MRVLVGGASGLIGSRLVPRLLADGHEVRTLVRRVPYKPTEFQWDPARRSMPLSALRWADTVVTLNGANLPRVLWSGKAKRSNEIDSWIGPAETITAAVGSLGVDAPTSWISASAVGFYGDRPGEVLTEDSTHGTGFLADLTVRWEAAADVVADRLRLVKARTGLVLAAGGALRPLVVVTKLGIGGRIGPGNQFWPWIALEDEVAAIAFAVAHPILAGPINLVAPTANTAEDVTRELARLLGRPHLTALPAPVLRRVLGDLANELLLADQHIVPQRLAQAGFEFAHPTLESALSQTMRLAPVPHGH